MKRLSLLFVLLVGCECPPDDLPDIDAAPDCGPGEPDAEPGCGETWGQCCSNNHPGGRCNPEAICNISDVCEPLCFPYCTDAG